MKREKIINDSHKIAITRKTIRNSRDTYIGDMSVIIGLVHLFVNSLLTGLALGFHLARNYVKW